MRAVVETNVIAYFLLGTKPFVEEARQFRLAVTAALAPAIWEAELANVVWMAIARAWCPRPKGRGDSNQQAGWAFTQ